MWYLYIIPISLKTTQTIERFYSMTTFFFFTSFGISLDGDLVKQGIDLEQSEHIKNNPTVPSIVFHLSGFVHDPSHWRVNLTVFSRQNCTGFYRGYFLSRREKEIDLIYPCSDKPLIWKKKSCFFFFSGLVKWPIKNHRQCVHVF